MRNKKGRRTEMSEGRRGGHGGRREREGPQAWTLWAIYANHKKILTSLPSRDFRVFSEEVTQWPFSVYSLLMLFSRIDSGMQRKHYKPYYAYFCLVGWLSELWWCAVICISQRKNLWELLQAQYCPHCLYHTGLLVHGNNTSALILVWCVLWLCSFEGPGNLFTFAHDNI